MVLCLIALTWTFTTRSIEAQRIEISDRVTATLTNQAFTFSEQVGRQILSLDQTLRILTRAWEADPEHFNLEAWRSRAVSVAGISRDVLLVDRSGVVRQSSLTDAIGRSVADRGYFRDALEHQSVPDQLFISPATIDPLIRLWHLSAARTLHYPDGSFGGVIVLDYRMSALTSIFGHANVGSGGEAMLIGIGDGRVRAAVGPATVDPEATLDGTPLFSVLRGAASGIWVGPSPSDTVVRIHAFRTVPGRDLAVVVAMVEQTAMAPALQWQFQARLFAAGVTVLLLVIAGMTLRSARTAQRREAALAEDRAVLAAANAQLEVARAEAVAKTEQLEATLAGMTDGVAMIDGHMCLVEWNARFPEIAGIPGDILRVGLPMEEILRAQARSGQFGPVDVETEVARRMARLRAGRFGVVERQKPDGTIMELRRNRLPDGGFVTLYSDITDRKHAENALREARAAAEAANVAKSRFVAIVSHEIRTPLNALLNTLRLLPDSAVEPSQRPLLDMARQSGDALSSLINDILDMSRAEAGQLSLRPSLFIWRGLCEGALEVFRAQAAVRGIRFVLDVADDVPTEWFTDPGRLRQVLLNLLSNAVKFSDSGEVRLITRMDIVDGREWVSLVVRDPGPAIPQAERELLFRPFSRLERGEEGDPVGSGLGLAICRHLVELMGGSIGCEAWTNNDGHSGNAFFIRLPLGLVPGRGLPLQPGALGEQQPGSHAAPPPRPAPRTRILLVEDIPANQIVTATLLRRDGHMVDVCRNGEEAIRAVDRTPYDLVLMDIFMPGMSGQEATQRIRAVRGPAAKAPIIALTAHVSADDEARFRAAGMDGMLSKPVALADLRGTIAQHVWGHEVGAQPSVTGPRAEHSPVAEGNGASPVLAGERIAELRANLPPETFATLVDECISDLEHRMPALRRALTLATPGSVSAQAHAMVGIAAGYGLVALETRLRDVMDAARTGRSTAFNIDAIASIEAELARAVAALRKTAEQEVA